MDILKKVESFNQKLAGTGCKLVAVSKKKSVEDILEAHKAGIRDFGENRVQELVPKSEALPHDIRWHMIGHLQTNKVKYIASFVHLIQSVDTMKLLKEINKQALRYQRTINCLLQVHIASEESKFGFSEDEIHECLNSKDFEEYSNIRTKGLMGMATFSDNTDQVRSEFRKLKGLFESIRNSYDLPNLSMEELSMGMTSDFKIAIEEGSTIVRVGTAIFGQRN